MKKILLIAKEGQIGWELHRALASLGTIIACNRIQCDISRHDLLRELVRSHQPQVIVNAGAYTAVDKAESEPELAFRINAQAPGVLAEEAKKLGSLLIHYSTDYVFDGQENRPYKEDDTTAPLNVYGRSKLAGEVAIESVGGKYLIFRTSWIFGRRRANFMKTMLELAKKQNTIAVTGDQIGCPTWSRLVAEATAQILAKDLSDCWGIYHMTCGGAASRYDLAEALFKLALESAPQLTKVTSDYYPVPAPRPKYSVLDNDKLYNTFGIRLPHWQQALELCLEGTKGT